MAALHAAFDDFHVRFVLGRIVWHGAGLSLAVAGQDIRSRRRASLWSLQKERCSPKNREKQRVRKTPSLPLPQRRTASNQARCFASILSLFRFVGPGDNRAVRRLVKLRTFQESALVGGQVQGFLGRLPLLVWREAGAAS